MGHSIPNPSLLKNSSSERWEEIPTFPKGISPKVDVIVLVEFKLSHYDVTVRLVNLYTTETSPFLWMELN